MSGKFQLQIPEPCHESWDKMDPIEKGRFCNSCQKAVVDFTGMSDAQLIAYFKKPSTNSLCGRFNNDQLNREFEIPRKRIPWLKYFFQFTIPVFLTGMKAQAQGNIRYKPDSVAISCSKPDESISVIAGKIGGVREVSGRVVDESGNGVPYASVYLKGTKNGTSCDSSGYFKINIPAYEETIVFNASCIGYTFNEKEIKARKTDWVEIRLKVNTQINTGVVVTGYGTIKGRFASYGAVSKIKTERSYLQKVKDYFIDDSINIFPNPVNTGEEIKIEWKKPNEGDYTIELYNIHSQLIQTASTKLLPEVKFANFRLPAVTPGTYVLRIINRSTGERRSEKIIIQ